LRLRRADAAGGAYRRAKAARACRTTCRRLRSSAQIGLCDAKTDAPAAPACVAAARARRGRERRRRRARLASPRAMRLQKTPCFPHRIETLPAAAPAAGTPRDGSRPAHASCRRRRGGKKIARGC